MATKKSIKCSHRKATLNLQSDRLNKAGRQELLIEFLKKKGVFVPKYAFRGTNKNEVDWLYGRAQRDRGDHTSAEFELIGWDNYEIERELDMRVLDEKDYEDEDATDYVRGPLVDPNVVSLYTVSDMEKIMSGELSHDGPLEFVESLGKGVVLVYDLRQMRNLAEQKEICDSDFQYGFKDQQHKYEALSLEIRLKEIDLGKLRGEARASGLK